MFRIRSEPEHEALCMCVMLCYLWYKFAEYLGNNKTFGLTALTAQTVTSSACPCSSLSSAPSSCPTRPPNAFPACRPAPGWRSCCSFQPNYQWDWLWTPIYEPRYLSIDNIFVTSNFVLKTSFTSTNVKLRKLWRFDLHPSDTRQSFDLPLTHTNPHHTLVIRFWTSPEIHLMFNWLSPDHLTIIWPSPDQGSPDLFIRKRP